MTPFLLAVPQSNPIHFLIGLTAESKPQLGGCLLFSTGKSWILGANRVSENG